MQDSLGGSFVIMIFNELSIEINSTKWLMAWNYDVLTGMGLWSGSTRIYSRIAI